MRALEIVSKAFATIEAGDFATADSLVSDDMVFAGPVPEPVGKKEFLGLHRALTSAFPDWRFNQQDLVENGDIVVGAVQITGTHTGPLSLPMLGIENYPPTGRKLHHRREPLTFTVKNGKITRIEAEVVPGGGVPGVLAALGVPMQQHH